MNQNSDKRDLLHNKQAPYWSIMLILFGVISLSTSWIDLGKFWRGYVLDIFGPVFNYILFRWRFTYKAHNIWTRFFTPVRTYLIFILVCFGIEGAQYLNLYESTFDPWDLLAYSSLLTLVFLIDLWQWKKEIKY